MNTTTVSINHPHAQTAILLASFHNPDRAHVARELKRSGTPRSLYTLARLLRAAQIVDEMAEADRKAAIDRVNAAHPAILRKAA